MKLVTLTQALRNQIMENYCKYKNDFSDEYIEELNNDENDLEEEIELLEVDDDEIEDYDELGEEVYSVYDGKIIAKLIADIKYSGYKKMIYFIILKDCLEYIKSKSIKGKLVSNSEKYLLMLLEEFNTQKLLNIIDKDDEFLLDIMTIFLEYNVICTDEEKYENRAILKTQKSKISKQFKLSILDDFQEYYEKNK